jgi:SAM-dependent methyltransferase
VWRILCTNYFARYIPANSTLLDIGSGWGEFINAIDGAEKIAMDLNVDAKTYLNPGIKHIHHDCNQKWPIDSNSLDVVFTSNFLEHLPDKKSIRFTVSEAYRCLKQGGRVICLGPNVKYVPGTYWDFWDHHVPITELSCSELLEITGFRVEKCLPRFLPYSMSLSMKPPLILVRLYLNLPLLWRFWGKQFLIIGRK